MPRFFLIALILCCSLVAQAQKELDQKLGNQETPVTNSGENLAGKKSRSTSGKKEKKKKEKGKFKKNWALPYPNPYRAGIYSLVLPSAGQIYNKRYWKLPFVWGGFAALVYSVNYNRDNFKCFNTAYGAEVRSLPHKYEQLNWTSDALRRQRDAFNKNLQMTYIGFVAMYALTALDAYVDAHLKNFDISDDLSLNVTAITHGGQLPGVKPAVGVVLRL